MLTDDERENMLTNDAWETMNIKQKNGKKMPLNQRP